MKKTVVLIALLAISACSEAAKVVNSDVTPAKLQSDTATYFATTSRNVRVGNLEKSVLGTAYQAKVAGRLFDCNYFRGTVSCNRAL